MSLTSDLKQLAKSLGFTSSGVCHAVTPTGFHRLHRWLEAGYAGSMNYLQNRFGAYRHPEGVLPGTKSLLMLAMNYRTDEPAETSRGGGRVSRYAWGSVDYHDLIHKRLKQMVRWLKERHPDCHARGVVDSAPLLEREFAQLAGLGWIGKHTLLLNPDHGSWFFLAAVLTDLELEADESFDTDHCGTCRACLDACPTDAFPQPYVLDATRCISYLTIESQATIPSELAEQMGDWLFGCDICQEVCPWNRKATLAEEADFFARDDLRPFDLHALFSIDDATFRKLYRRSPLWRAKRRGLLRNAAIALGNQRDKSALPVLREFAGDDDRVIGEACQWAINRITDSPMLNDPRE